MPFTPEERAALLKVKGVGETVIARLELLGLDSFEKLSRQDAAQICANVAAMLKAPCWNNAPRAHKAIQAAIDRARQPR